MKPLVTNRRALTWFCILPLDSNTSILKRALFIMLTVFLYTSVFTGVMSSVIFFANNVSVDLENSLYSVMQIAGFSNMLYLYVVAFVSRKRINRFLVTLDEIYEESK